MAEEETKKKRGPPVEILPNKQLLQMQGFGTFNLKDAQLLTDLLRKGLQLGTYRHIDTARKYNNEIALGTAIKTVIAEGRVKREELFITTKVWNLKGESVQREVKEALQLMQLKYFDMLYLHWPYVDSSDTGEFNHKPLEEFWAEMELCVTKGYVRHLAVSNINGQLLMELLSLCKIKPVALQVEVHPYFPNTALVELAQKNGIIVIAHTPLIRGDNLNRDEVNILKDEVILDLASKHGRTPAQIVLKSTLQRGVGVIPKTSNPARIQENL